MIRRRTILRTLVVVVASALTGCRGRSAVADTANGADAVLVGTENIVIVESRELRYGPTLAGTIEPERDATIRAEVSGAVVQTYAEPGQHVNAGQVLARLDDSAIRDQALSARAGVATARNANDIAKRNLERAEALLKAGAIADRDAEQARNAALAAQTQLANATAIYASAQKQLNKTSIVAPFKGVVSARQVNAGDVVQPGGALFTVVDPSSMQLEASVPAQSLALVRVGLPVEFTVSGYESQHFTGRVTRVNPTADPATGQVRIIATIPNAGATLVGGLFAQGRIAAETRTAPVLPLGAVDEHGVRPSVMRIQNGKVAKVEVELGLRDEQAETVEIRSGLTPGDTVLLGTARGLTPGTPVKVSVPNDVRR